MDDPGLRVLSVLLVEDNQIHAELIERHLSTAGNGTVRLDRAQRLSEALELLAHRRVDVLLLDLSLPDSRIEETLPRVIDLHGDIPIIVLTSLNDLDFGTRAVQQGAQDYLVKTDLNGQLLVRAIHYAIERKKTKDRLETYATDLERSNEHLKSFAHTVAHEVKSPLHIVESCLDMLQSKHGSGFDQETGEMTRHARSSIRGLTELVNELLDFARVGSEDVDGKEIDAEAIFYQVFVMLRPMVRAGNVQLTHDPLPKVYANEIQFRQLLQNLVANAIKYRSDQPPRIHVTAMDHANEWRFAISDNGLGIPEEQRERVFDAFVRLHQPDEIPGTGIGLAFCKRIVQHHGGRIWVESNEGGGSCFYFTLPKKTS